MCILSSNISSSFAFSVSLYDELDFSIMKRSLRRLICRLMLLGATPTKGSLCFFLLAMTCLMISSEDMPLELCITWKTSTITSLLSPGWSRPSERQIFLEASLLVRSNGLSYFLKVISERGTSFDFLANALPPFYEGNVFSRRNLLAANNREKENAISGISMNHPPWSCA